MQDKLHEHINYADNIKLAVQILKKANIYHTYEEIADMLTSDDLYVSKQTISNVFQYRTKRIDPDFAIAVIKANAKWGFKIDK